MSKYDNAMKLMDERFGHDTPLSVATVVGTHPSVRMVDAYYENGTFYSVTHTLSNKMKQIAANPDVAVCGEWFTAHGVGENLGYVRDERNAEMMSKLRAAFAEWYDNGHVDEEDPNTCLLRIRLTDGVLTDNESKYGEWQYKIDFTNHTA